MDLLIVNFTCTGASQGASQKEMNVQRSSEVREFIHYLNRRKGGTKVTYSRAQEGRDGSWR